MSRHKREWYPGAIYHVMSRGNRRSILYKDESDYMNFLDCIVKAQEVYPFKLHSLCLMSNHFHMALETIDDDLGKIMQRMLHPYTMDFNHKYHFTGHLFESRYTACLVTNEQYFLEVSRYIHLNPVKAHMVQEPLAYEYSSYGKFVPVDGAKKKATKLIEDLVETDRVLGGFMNNSRELYKTFVEGMISHTEQEQLIQKDIRENDMWLPY